MQRYTIIFIIINALHVSGGFSAHHQEHKNCTHCTVPLAEYSAYSSCAPDDGRRNRQKHVEHW